MIWTILVLLTLVQVGLPLALYAARDRMLFLPSTRPTTEEGLAWFERVDAELLVVHRSDGRPLAGYDVVPANTTASISSLHFPSASRSPSSSSSPSSSRSPSTSPDRTGPVLLFLHGNAANAALRVPWLDVFADNLGLRVVLASYSGYGGNAGRPSETDLYLDAAAFFDHLVEGGVEPRRIVLYGESVGAAAALRIAVERPTGGVITQGAFSSLRSMVRRVYPWLPVAATIVGGQYPNDARAATLDVPLLIVHGTADDIIPFAEAERLHASAPRSELLPVPGAGHNDLFEVGGRRYTEEIARRAREWTGDAR